MKRIIIILNFIFLMPMFSQDCIGIDKIMKEWIRNDNISVKENKVDFEIIIYPNPSENQLTIKSTDAQIIYFELIDVSGKVIFRKDNIYQNVYILERKNIELKTGFYIAKINSKNTVKSIPIIIEK